MSSSETPPVVPFEPFEIKEAPGSWRWPQGVIGWMIWKGNRQVAWFADKVEAEIAIRALQEVGACLPISMS